MKTIIILLIFIISAEAKDYNQNKKTIAFINMMETEYNYKRSYLKKLFSDVYVQKTPLRIFSKRKRKVTSNEKKRLSYFMVHGTVMLNIK